MDIDDFLNNGVTVKNANYKKPTKKNPIGSPKFVQSNNFDDTQDRDSRIGTMLSQDSYDLTGLNNHENQYDTHDVRINPVNTQEELNQSRAKNQSAMEQTGRFAIQAVGNEIVLGTALGLSNLIDMGANVAKDSGENDYTNPFSKFLEDKQDEVKKRFEIYQQNPDDKFQIGDYGWWASNAVSVASTLSLLVPSMGVTKGLSAIGKFANLEKISLGIAKAAKELNLTKGAFTLSKAINAGAEIGTSALLSRTMENYQEARGVYKEVYDKYADKIKNMSGEERTKLLKNNPDLVGKNDEEIAQHISGLSADETFKNDFAMLLMDIVQFKALGSMWKGIASKEESAALRLANKAAIGELAGEGGEAASKLGFLDKRKEIFQHALKNPLNSIEAAQLSEGFEEAFQGIQTEKGKEVAERIMDPNYKDRDLQSYLTDGAIWEQAFWGAAGGIAFQAAGSALGNVSDTIKGKINKKNMSEQDYALSQMTDEKVREQEIKSRKARMQNYTDGMQLLSQGKNPFGYKLDPDTKQPILDNGSKVNDDIDSDQAEQLKTKLTNDFVTNMVLDATDKGNYDLLKDYITDQNFNKFFQDAGLESTAGDKTFSTMLNNKMDEVYEQYHGALYDVLNSVDVNNEGVAKIVARNIARRKLEIADLYNTSDDLAGQISENSDNNDYYDYEENERIRYSEQRIAEINNKEEELKKLLDNKTISKQAHDEVIKENNVRKNQLLAFASTNNMFGNPDTVKRILSNNINNANTNEFLAEFNRFVNDLNVNPKNIASPKKSIQDLIKKKIELDDHVDYVEKTLPTTQANYQSEYDDIARHVDKITVDRYNKATDIVGEYLESHPNLDEARDNIMTNNVPDNIKDQLDILKLGHHSTQQYTSQINAILKEITKNKDTAAKEAKNVTVDNSTNNNAIAEADVLDLNTVVEQTDSREEVTDDSSTGKVEQSSPVDAEIAVNNEPTATPIQSFDVEEEVATLDKVAQSVEQQRVDDFILDNDARAVGFASSITFNLFKTSRNLFDNLEGKDVNSAEFNNIVAIVADELFVQGVSRGYIQKAAIDGIKMALTTIYRRLNAKNVTGADKFKVLADQLATKQRIEIVETKVNNSTTRNAKDFKVGDVVPAFVGTTKNSTIESIQFPVNGAIKVRILFKDGETLYLDDVPGSFYNIDDYNTFINSNSESTTVSNSTTSLIPNSEFNQVIDQFIDTYIQNKGVYTVKGSKTIINVEDLFRELLSNDGISYDQAKHIFFNIADYIKAINNSKYIFTNKTELNKNLKTPSIFFSNLVNSKTTTETIDTYMHIAAPSKVADGYNKAISEAISGEPIEITYYEGEYGTSTNSISIKRNGVEIGYLGSVTPNATNTGYSLKNQKIGFVYNLNNNNGVIESNLDKLFIPLIKGADLSNKKEFAISEINNNSINWNNDMFSPRPALGIEWVDIRKGREDLLNNKDTAAAKKLIDAIDTARQNGGYNFVQGTGIAINKTFVPIVNTYKELMDIAYKQFAFETGYKNNSIASAISDEDSAKVLSNPAIKSLIASGDIKIPERKVTSRQKSEYILNAINNIIFYDSNAITNDNMLESYSYWKASTFNNYINTHKIQTALNSNKKITTKLVNVVAGKVLLDINNHDVNTRGFTYEQNPIMIVDVNGNIINESNNTTYNNVAGFEPGTMGMLITNNAKAPVIALFTQANKLSDNKELANRVYTELTNILNDFQNKNINFNVLSTKLSDMFSGPGVKSNNLFSGYSVIRTSDKVALNIQGRKGEYNLIIHKFEKGNNKEGTGITYIPNGDKTKASSSISNDKKFVNTIAKEVVSNLTFNKTFYAVNNKNVDNDKSNQYLYKENGKVIVNIGGKVDTYDSFGHFVLTNNAFKTNQGISDNGSYFDVVDKVKSLNINTAIINSPVEESGDTTSASTATDMIKTASKTQGINTSDLLTKAGIANDQVAVLTGTNAYNIELIPKETYFDNKATKAEAYYTKGKMFFTNKGANAISKSPANLVRLLIHENLHAKFEEQGLFQKANIVDDLLNTYQATFDAVHSDTTSKEAAVIRKWFADNKFNPNEYFTTLSVEQQKVWDKKTREERDRQFAEEWLVESLTQPAIIRYLNNTIYSGEDISVEGIDNNAKTIWQKIVDVLLKLFGKNTTNIKNNTILAQQYAILGNTTNVADSTDTTTEINKNDNTPGESPIAEVVEEQIVNDNASANDFQVEDKKLDEDSDIDDLDFAVTNMIESTDDINIAAFRASGNVNTAGIQVITNMNNYVNQFAEQDKPLIAKMMAANELKFVCE